jgi:hypothetical protein
LATAALGKSAFDRSYALGAKLSDAEIRAIAFAAPGA